VAQFFIHTWFGKREEWTCHAFCRFFVALLMLSIMGCKSESEAAASDIADKQQEMVKILKSVKDKDSAVVAKGKLEALGKTWANSPRR